MKLNHEQQIFKTVEIMNDERGIEKDKGNGVLSCVSTSTDYQEPIDIYSKKGTKVKYTGKGGYDHHKEYANKHLKVGEIYTIDHTDVGGWHTDVYLKEVPDKAFNSVHFVDAE